LPAGISGWSPDAHSVSRIGTVSMHPALQRLIDSKLAHTVARQWMLPIAEVRKGFRALWTPAMTGTPLPVARVDDIAIASAAAAIPARVYAPERDRRSPLLVYLHGGGYVKGGLDESDTFCRNLARLTMHTVISVDYRLAPEHPFPAALDDALAATAWACVHAADIGAEPGPIVLCGESAGGNLAAVTCLRALKDPRIGIRYQVLLQPVVDFAMSFASMTMKPTDCLVPREDLDWYYRTYAGQGYDAKDPSLSPLYASDLSRLPPALIIAAEYDTLRDEAEAYAGRLAASGVSTAHACYPGMIHGFLQMGGLVPDARAAIEHIARAIGAGVTAP
jgi:acetyl esterase